MIRSLALALVLCSVSAAQSEVWVDPVHGDDTFDGQTSGSAWRTIGHAIGSTSGVVHVHLLPGTYGPASGESFPILVPYRTRLVSTDGSGATTLDATATGASLAMSLQRDAVVEGVTLALSPASTSVNGVGVQGFANTTARLRDVIVSGGAVGLANAGGSATVTSCSFLDQSVAAISWSEGGSLTVSDSRIERCAGPGVRLSLLYLVPPLEARFDRTSIVDCGADGIAIHPQEFGVDIRATLVDCVVARNGGHGIHTVPSFASAGADSAIRAEGTTIAANTGSGVLLTASRHQLHLSGSIVASNGAVDLDAGGSLVRSLVGDGSGVAGVGKLTGDPGFVDVAAGDLTLRQDSQCVDAGVIGASNRDHVGHHRFVDGDLDLVPAPDMGAFEHRTLVAPSAVRFDESFDVLVSGPAGGFSTVVLNHSGFAPFGLTTQYGRFFLPAVGSYRIVPIATTGGAPVARAIAAFDDPALAGTSTGVQALTRSSASPSGGAFSEPALVRID